MRDIHSLHLNVVHEETLVEGARKSLRSAPGIPQFHQTLAVAELDCAQNSEGLTPGKALLVSLRFRARLCAAHHEVVALVLRRQQLPESVLVQVLVLILLKWRPSEHLHGLTRDALNDVLVAAKPLCKCLLQEPAPNGLRIKGGEELIVLGHVHGQEVVNHDGLGEAQSEDIDRVDACGTETLVEEKLFDASRELSESCNCSDEPAVADELFRKFLWVYTSSWEETSLRKGLTSALPREVLLFL